MLFSLQCRLPQNLLFDLVRVIESLAFSVIVVSSNNCVRLSPRTKIFFSLLSICVDELLLK